MSAAPVSFHDLHPTADDLAADVLTGFSRAQKSIPPKYFYDAEGSRLFDAITDPLMGRVHVDDDQAGGVLGQDVNTLQLRQRIAKRWQHRRSRGQVVSRAFVARTQQAGIGLHLLAQVAAAIAAAKLTGQRVEVQATLIRRRARL